MSNPPGHFVHLPTGPAMLHTSAIPISPYPLSASKISCRLKRALHWLTNQPHGLSISGSCTTGHYDGTLRLTVRFLYLRALLKSLCFFTALFDLHFNSPLEEKTWRMKVASFMHLSLMETKLFLWLLRQVPRHVKLDLGNCECCWVEG